MAKFVPPPLYAVWASMTDRCYNTNSPQYHNYGGRGIAVCDAWRTHGKRKSGAFQTFISDMGPRPDGYSIDRIDTNGNYEPKNCRWADDKTQQRNKRDAVFVIIQGVRHRAIELAELAGKKTDTILERVAKGLTYEEVVDPNIRPTDKSGLSLGGEASAAKKRAMTHCKRGHMFTMENTFVSKRDGSRHCRQCHNAKMRRRNQAKLASLNAATEKDTLEE